MLFFIVLHETTVCYRIVDSPKLDFAKRNCSNHCLKVLFVTYLLFVNQTRLVFVENFIIDVILDLA